MNTSTASTSAIDDPAFDIEIVDPRQGKRMYRVFWLYSARMQLAEFWVNADSELRSAITAGAAELDRQLKRDPHNCGESRDPNEQVHAIGPLVAQFSVDDENHEVTVLAIHVYKYRPRS